MTNRKLILTFLVIIPMLFGLILSPATYSSNSILNNENTGSSGLVESYKNDMSTKNDFALSQDTQEGILNPNAMTQRGYQTTDVFRARTDSGQNAQQNITIDEANDWTVSKTEIQVGNLRKLYAQNGTFEEEVDPWTSSTYDASSGNQVQSAVWNSTEGYVTLVNYGEFKDKNPPQDDTYTHHFDSEILWEQTISNSPQTDNFSLSFDFRYVSGPLDPAPYDLAGDVELRIYIHTDVYYMSLCEIDARNVWYSISDFPIELLSAPANFDIAIGFYFEYGDLVLTENGDYNGDSAPDGLINAQKIELHLDDIGFASQAPVSYGGVDLTFNVEGSSGSITGPTGGTGSATITTPTPWDVSPLEIEVTANSSVSFDFGVITYFQRDINSSWTTDLGDHGVSYSIDAGQSASLEMYSYIAPVEDYQNLTLEIQYPSDWENTTIKDSLNNDITGLCTISAGSIFIPNNLYDRVGWWKITHESLNYAKDISIQIQDTGTWTDSSLFRTSNLTRTQVELGTASATPGIGSPINIDWIMPNGTVWASDSISNIINGYANSSAWILGGTNTSAGLWEVQIFWNNGTELAYGFDTFDLYHQASASVQYPSIETDYGLVLSNQIIFTDTDTGEYLLDDSVSITANWSDTTVVFSQNFAMNWWQADFDTALLENGVFTVIVDISRPYFDPITIQFTVISIFETVLNFEDDVTSTTVEFAEPFELKVYYDRLNPSEFIQEANISVIQGDIAELDIDIIEYTEYYSIMIRGYDVGSWALSVVANKADYRVATKSFFIEVEEIDTSVQGSSPLETLLIGCSYDFTFSFIFESNSSYIPGATISPFGDGADWVIFVELGSGQYSVNLTPQELGEHSVILTFERVGFESASFRLYFNVGRVPITVEVLQGLSGPEYSESVLSIRISESDTGLPVSGVEVFCYIIDPNGASSGSIALVETTMVGVYSGTISMPIADGEYQLQITCDATDYVMTSDFIVDLEPNRDLATMLWVTTTQYYPIILAFAALGFGLVYRRSSRKKRIRENKATLAIKRRFDDIRSLMGVIVLHKDSGLPIYSKILRDGLEEVVISAFITAITSFRGEFDIESSSEEWGLIPISDIIRVISTNKLVCAFITTGNPSPEQRERMIQFAKTVGFIFDDTMEEVPIVVLDHHTTRQFDSLFEDLLDGQLLRTYKLDDVKKFPTNSCANERIARRHGDEFKLEELATEIASCGLEEGRVYKAIMEALDNHFLVSTDNSPFATELLRAPDIVEEES